MAPNVIANRVLTNALQKIMTKIKLANEDHHFLVRSPHLLLDAKINGYAI